MTQLELGIIRRGLLNRVMYGHDNIEQALAQQMLDRISVFIIRKAGT